MSRFRPSVLTVVLASACGPIVPFGGENDDGIDVTDDGDDDDDDDDGDDDRPGDPGGDDRPPDPDGGDIDDGGDELDTESGGVCGDGFVDGDEECDDGNDTPSDGCEADCTGTPPGTLLRETIQAGEGDDAARAVALMPSGELLVAGSLEIEDQDRLWLRVQYDEQSWDDHTPALEGDALGTSIAVVGESAFVAGMRPQADSAVLFRYAGELAEIPGAPTDIFAFAAVASPTAEGFVLVTNGGGFEELVSNVRRFDPNGVMIADVPQPSEVFVGAAAPDAAGGTILGGGSFGGMGSAVWVAALASDASTAWTWSEEAVPDLEVRVRGIAAAPDGRVVAVGTRGIDGPGNGNDTGWIWWWSPDGVLESDGPLEIGGAAARPIAVVVGANGIVVGGTTIDVDDGFVAGFDLDGALQWGHQLAGDFGIEDGVLALAIDPGVAVYAVGWLTQLHTGEDAWIGVFSD